MYNHRVPRSIRVNKAKRLTGKKSEDFCYETNSVAIYAPASDHRGIGFVERLIQTMKQLSCMTVQRN